MKRSFFIPVLFALLCLIILISFSLGRYPVSIGDIVRFFTARITDASVMDERQHQILKNILLDIRLPRIIAAILIGAALSVSGAVYQSMFMNPLVSPGILGVLAGASFGAALGMLISPSWVLIQGLTVLFGLVAVGIAVGMAACYRGDRVLMLILGGVVSSALFTSLVSLVKYMADPNNQLPAIVYWLMGSLAATDMKTVGVVSIPILLGILVSFLLSGYLNILSMGDEEARSLGVNTRRIRVILIFLSTLISALTVAMGGIISWVGLIIPHMARMIVGPDNRILLPVSALMGAAYLLVVDDISRLLFSTEIPIGILTSLVGIPFFALILRNARKGWS